MSDTQDTLLEFPCQFSVKAFGKKAADATTRSEKTSGETTDGEATRAENAGDATDAAFEQLVYSLVKPHVPELTPDDLSARESSGGRYLSVTVSIQAQSKAQLDAIYQDLTASGQVIMSL